MIKFKVGQKIIIHEEKYKLLTEKMGGWKVWDYQKHKERFIEHKIINTLQSMGLITIYKENGFTKLLKRASKLLKLKVRHVF